MVYSINGVGTIEDWPREKKEVGASGNLKYGLINGGQKSHK